MNILVGKDFIASYLLSRQKTFHTELDRIRINVIGNENNMIVFSKNYIEFLEKEFVGHALNSDFTDVMLELMDDEKRGKSLTSNKATTNADEELLALFQLNEEDFTIILSEDPVRTIPFAYNLSAMKSPNKHWLFGHLAAYHSAIIPRHLFNADQEIQYIFDAIFAHRVKIEQIYYFDRHCYKIKKHDRFKGISKKGKNISVYTYAPNQGTPSIAMSNAELIELRDKIVNYFGPICSLSYTRKSKLLHGRRLMFNNLIIKTDHDFALINMENKDWTISVEFSRTNFQKYISDAAAFSQV